MPGLFGLRASLRQHPKATDKEPGSPTLGLDTGFRKVLKEKLEQAEFSRCLGLGEALFSRFIPVKRLSQETPEIISIPMRGLDVTAASRDREAAFRSSCKRAGHRAGPACAGSQDRNQRTEQRRRLLGGQGHTGA